MNESSWRDTIKKQAKEEGLRVRALLALAEKNDPFYKGSPADLQKAQWFADLIFEFPKGVHLRRMHYNLQARPDPRRPDGMPYENTNACWNYLQEAGKVARYLGFVPTDYLTDSRNPPPRIYAEYFEDELPSKVPEIGLHNTVSLFYFDYESVEDFARKKAVDTLHTMDIIGGLTISRQSRQRYHLELWCEKSTMDDIIVPICKRYHINFILGLGELSITAVSMMIEERLRKIHEVCGEGKPVRIFYLCDHDPKGDGMPRSISRKFEWFSRCREPDLDIRLMHLALTLDQCEEFALPRKPIKKGSGEGSGAKSYDTLTAGFECRYSEGAVELDALEALHPGELVRIIEEAVSPYYDKTISERVWEERQRIENDIKQRIEEAILRERDNIEPTFHRIKRKYEEINEMITDARAELEDLVDELNHDLVGMDIDPDVGVAGIRGAMVEEDDDRWLFDSARSYQEQLEKYKTRIGRRGVSPEEGIT